MKEIKTIQFSNYIIRRLEEEIQVKDKKGKEKSITIGFIQFTNTSGALSVTWRADSEMYYFVDMLLQAIEQKDSISEQYLDLILTNIQTVAFAADVVDSFKVKKTGKTVTDGLQYSVMNAILDYQKRLKGYELPEVEKDTNDAYETFEKAKETMDDVSEELDRR